MDEGIALKHAVMADGVLAIHFLIASFAVFGGFLVALDWRWMLLHIPAALWS